MRNDILDPKSRFRLNTKNADTNSILSLIIIIIITVTGYIYGVLFIHDKILKCFTI